MTGSVATLIGGGVLKCLTAIRRGVMELQDFKKKVDSNYKVYDEWVRCARSAVACDSHVSIVLKEALEKFGIAILIESQNPTSLFKVVRAGECNVLFLPLPKENTETIHSLFNVSNSERFSIPTIVDGDMYGLVLRSNIVMSDVFKGIEFTHACHRALSFSHRMSAMSSRVKSQSSHDYVRDEISALETVTHPLLREIGGRPYHILVHKKKKLFGKLFQEPTLINVIRSRAIKDVDSLDAIFGPSESDFETVRRSALHTTHVAFEFFREAFPPHIADEAIFNFIKN